MKIPLPISSFFRSLEIFVINLLRINCLSILHLLLLSNRLFNVEHQAIEELFIMWPISQRRFFEIVSPSKGLSLTIRNSFSIILRLGDFENLLSITNFSVWIFLLFYIIFIVLVRILWYVSVWWSSLNTDFLSTPICCFLLIWAETSSMILFLGLKVLLIFCTIKELFFIGVLVFLILLLHVIWRGSVLQIRIISFQCLFRWAWLSLIIMLKVSTSHPW